VISLFARFIVMSQRRPRFLTQTSRVVVQCQPWFYLRLVAYDFFWLSEGAYGLSRDSLPKAAVPPNGISDTHPRTRAPEAPMATAGDESRAVLHRRSSCLLFQMFSVETDSFLPNQQSDRRNLARQGEACHGRLHSSGN
jgi:hypothetical protein